MYKIKLTNEPSGSTRTIKFAERASAELFIEELPKRLPIGSRVKIDADLLGIRGYVGGLLK